jgi:hypothetical protein
MAGPLWVLRLPCNKNSYAIADIRTTMNVYRDVVTDEMAVASGKVTRLALDGLQTDCKPS